MINFAYSRSNESRSKASLQQKAEGGPPTYTSFATEFGRYPQVYTQHDLAEWKESFLYTASQILQAKSTNNWPMQLDSCYDWGACGYTSLCEQQCEPTKCNTENFEYIIWDPRVR
jgi:hypothetical protein